MAKYSRDLDKDLVEKVEAQVRQRNLITFGIQFEVIRLNSRKSIGEVMKGNDLVQMYANNDSLVVIAINEEAFDLVNEETQNYWIENLLSQVSYDDEKDKINIQKPELNVNLGMYYKYKQKAIDMAESAVLVLQQMVEKDKQLKEAAKEAQVPKTKKKKTY